MDVAPLLLGARGMIAATRRMLDRLWGSGEAAVTLPPMDGALRPNRKLEEATALAATAAPDNLALTGSQVVFTSANTLFSIDAQSGMVEQVQVLAETITGLASAPDGGLALGLADGSISFRGGAFDGRVIATSRDTPFGPTALAFDGDRTLYACIGSTANGPDEWKRDLMERRSCGHVLRFDLATSSAPVRIAGDLGWPNGIIATGAGEVIVAESWKHRLLSIEADGRRRTVLDDLPGYPARLTGAAGGAGYWLTVFAPRTQLVEFILREPGYRSRMMREVEPEYWMAPSLHAPRSFLEPLQGGAVKQLGILKPWSPSRSSGLVIRLDQNCQAVSSLHSRADGLRHGVTSCLDLGGRLLVASKGGNALLVVDVEAYGSGA